MLKNIRKNCNLNKNIFSNNYFTDIINNFFCFTISYFYNSCFALFMFQIYIQLWQTKFSKIFLPNIQLDVVK